jgi:hypothetical protein
MSGETTRGSDDIAGNTNDKQAPQALIKHELRRDARIRTPEDDREGLLSRRQFGASGVA